MERDWKKKYHILYLVWIFTVIILIGGIMNFIVIKNNEGKMPVYNAYTNDNNYITFIEHDEINNWYLSDIFDIGYIIFSIGDFVMIFGMTGMIWFAVKDYFT